MPRVTEDLPHFTSHPVKDMLILWAYYLATMQICIWVTRQAGLHYIFRRSEATWRFLGYYSSTVQKSTPGMTIDPPHFSLQWNSELQMSCDYCWTIMQTHKHATTMGILHCIAPHCAVALRMLR